MYRGKFVEYGNNPITVNKKSGKIEKLRLATVENLGIYRESHNVVVPEKYMYHRNWRKFHPDGKI